MSIPPQLQSRINNDDHYRQCLPSTFSLLLSNLPPPPPAPNTISSPIMLEQLNGTSKHDQRELVVTYRRLEPIAPPPPIVGDCKPSSMSPVSSPSRISVSSSPALPIESASTNAKDILRNGNPERRDYHKDNNNIIEHGLHGEQVVEDPLAKLQNALESGFLGRKLFSPLNESRPQDEHYQQIQSQVAAANVHASSPDSYAKNGANSNDNILYRCHICSYQVDCKVQFNEHVNTHFDHKCNFCDYTSRTEGRLKRHVKDFHCEVPPESWAGTRVPRNEDGVSGGESNGSTSASQSSKSRNFKCKQCNHVAKSKNEFWQHSKSHIKTEKLLTCPKCPFVTEYKHHLEYHLRNHFGSKPFKCGKCNYSCVNKSMLNSHLKSHSNIYQYRCKDCSYATKYCHSLKLHLRKYMHQPATVLNSDGSPNPLPVIDVYGTRRGPRPKKKTEVKTHSSQRKSPHSIVSSTISTSPSSSALPTMDNRGSALATVNFNHLPQAIAQNPWMYQSHLMASFHAGMFANRPTILNEMGHHVCAICPFTTDDPDLFSKHIMGHAAAESQDIFNAYGYPPDVCRDDGSNHSSFHDMNEQSVNRDTPPVSDEMDASLSSPPCPGSSPDALTEEYSHEEPVSTSQSFNDDILHEVAGNEILNRTKPTENGILESLVPKISQPTLQTPPKTTSERNESSCPLDLSNPREEQIPSGHQSSSSTTSSRNRRKGKACKLNRPCIPINDAPEDGDDESENYPPTAKQAKNMSPNRISSPFKEINKTLSLPLKLPIADSLESLEKIESFDDVQATSEGKDFYASQIVEKQSPTSSSTDTVKVGLANWKREAYDCEFCEISFGDCVMYTMHMGYHGYQDPFKCNMCGEACKDKVSFFLHICRFPHLYG